MCKKRGIFLNLHFGRQANGEGSNRPVPTLLLYSTPVVLKLGSIKPQGFDESGSGVQRRLAKVYTLHTLRVIAITVLC